MNLPPQTRYRVNAKMTSHGLVYFDATIEHDSLEIAISENEKDKGDTTSKSIPRVLFDLIKESENVARADGHKLARDQPLPALKEKK